MLLKLGLPLPPLTLQAAGLRAAAKEGSGSQGLEATVARVNHLPTSRTNTDQPIPQIFDPLWGAS